MLAELCSIQIQKLEKPAMSTVESKDFREKCGSLVLYPIVELTSKDYVLQLFLN